MHLRRPSKFSTIGLPDTQPFDDPDGRFAFSHNGDLEHHQVHPVALPRRGPAVRQGGHRGQCALAGGPLVRGRLRPDALTKLHDTFGGHANLAILTRTGEAHHYAGNDENPVFTFHVGEIRLACTGMYSLDRSVFKYVVPEATNRRLVPFEQTATL